MTSLSNQFSDVSDKSAPPESEALAQTRESLPDDEVLYDLAELFQGIRRHNAGENSICAV